MWQQTLLTEDLKQKTRKNIEEIILCHPPAVPDTFMVDAAKYLRCGKNNCTHFCQENDEKFAHAYPFIFPPMSRQIPRSGLAMMDAQMLSLGDIPSIHT